MSIISCPECGKKMSSLARLCNNCGFQRGEASEEQLAVYRQRQARQKVYQLNMASYAVISAFVAGFGWYWWDSAGYTEPAGRGPFILMGLAAVAYVVVRALLFRARRHWKELRR